jgi:hypothetical protein
MIRMFVAGMGGHDERGAKGGDDPLEFVLEIKTPVLHARKNLLRGRRADTAGIGRLERLRAL